MFYQAKITSHIKSIKIWNYGLMLEESKSSIRIESNHYGAQIQTTLNPDVKNSKVIREDIALLLPLKIQ